MSKRILVISHSIKNNRIEQNIELKEEQKAIMGVVGTERELRIGDVGLRWSQHQDVLVIEYDINKKIYNIHHVDDGYLKDFGGGEELKAYKEGKKKQGEYKTGTFIPRSRFNE